MCVSTLVRPPTSWRVKDFEGAKILCEHVLNFQMSACWTNSEHYITVQFAPEKITATIRATTDGIDVRSTRL